MPSKDKYTDPKLRDEIKEEVQQSDKGGAPGQWSARKAQLMASEYKKRGGDYKGEKDESQKNLQKWGDEDWQTKDGSGNAKKEDGTQQRYLPKKAWENMSDKEKEETDAKKQEGSKKGKQFVPNTDKAKSSRKKASKKDAEDDEDADDDQDEDDDDQENGDDEEREGDEEEDDEDEDDYQENDDDDDEAEDDGGDDGEAEDEDDDKKSSPKKRKAALPKGNSKKQKKDSDDSSKKTIGSKHMPADEPAPRGSNDRLPKKGQKITWKAMPGYVDGEVVEVLHKGKTVDGKSVKASEDDPKLVLKSKSSGKVSGVAIDHFQLRDLIANIGDRFVSTSRKPAFTSDVARATIVSYHDIPIRE
jgi:hypothetical protein